MRGLCKSNSVKQAKTIFGDNKNIEPRWKTWRNSNGSIAIETGEQIIGWFAIMDWQVRVWKRIWLNAVKSDAVKSAS